MFNLDAPKYLYSVGVNFEDVNVPVAAEFYYRLGLWLEDCGCLKHVMPGTVESLAIAHRIVLCCDEKLKTSATDDRALWKNIKRTYEQQLQETWHIVWRVIRERVNTRNVPSETVLNYILNDDSRSAEIAVLHKFAPYIPEQQPQLPAFDLTDWCTDELECADFDELSAVFTAIGETG